MSMIDVAKRAGVSTATVSYIVNGRAGVSPETEQRVRDAMAKLSYTPPHPTRRRGPRPNHQQKADRACLALIILQLSPAQLNAPIYVPLLGSVEATARSRGYSLLFHKIEAGGEVALEALTKQADGLILFGIDMSAAPKILRSIPCVRVMAPKAETEAWYDHVTYKDNLTGSLAAEYLASRGHKHCVAIGVSGGTNRASIFAAAMKERGGIVTQIGSEGLVDESSEYCLANHEAFRALVHRILELNPRPTGLFVDSDMLAAFIHPVLRERGVRIGADMEIVSVNYELPLIGNLYPRPASIDLHVDQIAQVAVDRLIWRLSNPDAVQTDILLTPTLRPGSEH